MKPFAPIAALAIALCAAAAPASAQDYQAMINQSMARMNAIVAQAQNGVQQMVQQRMHDPAVQAAWQQYVARSGGRPAMDYPTFTYQYVATRGFSAAGTAAYYANERDIQSRERAAWAGWQQAQANRGRAQQQWSAGYASNQQEAGRQLMGQSTYTLPNGQGLQLPHTWQPNTTHQYQGGTYHVDAGGRYHVLAANGWWYPLGGGR